MSKPKKIPLAPLKKKSRPSCSSHIASDMEPTTSKSLTEQSAAKNTMANKIALGKTQDVRTVALSILLAVEKGHHVQAMLDAALQKNALSLKDQALCTELTYGTLRYYFRLNAILDAVLTQREKLPKPLQMLLRTAIYALLFLDRIPHHATVHHAVQSAKQRFGPHLAKVVNASLREAQRLKQACMEQSFYKKLADFYAMPSWLYGYLVKAYGNDTAQILCDKFLQRPKMSLRLNPNFSEFSALDAFFANQSHTQKIGHSGYVFLQGHVSREALGQSMSAWHEQGAFSWQASGSQEVLHQCLLAVPELKKDVVWDACAGQGGKTLAMLEQHIPVLLASDVSFRRLALLAVNGKRLGFHPPHTVLGEAQGAWFACKENSFEGTILLDVPCTGFGTLARRPEIRLHRSYEDLQTLVHVQKNILEKAFCFLAKGRHMVYMTCTYTPLENEQQIELFLQTHSQAEEVFRWQTPFAHPFLEGMFVSVMRKK